MENKNIIQILKDNAFYVVLALGLLAILAVVAIYTANARRTDNEISQEIDLNEPTEMVQQDTVILEDATSVMQNEITEEDTEEKTEAKKKEVPVTTTEEAPVPVVASATITEGELDFKQSSTLSWPVVGNVIIPFSMETTVYFKTLDQYQCNPGMLIEAKTGTKVNSAYLGLVKSVESSNEFGNMVKVYIGNGYYIHYGQLKDIAVKEGDYVKAGDLIGEVAEPTDFYVQEGPHLFLQMLSEEEPVNPTLYMD